MGAEPHIQVKDLALSYQGVPTLRDVNLGVSPCSVTAVIGPSGCGKSSFLTTLNRLCDMVEGCRVNGRVRVAGMDVFSPKTDVLSLRKRVGMIFQDPNPFPLSIEKNIALPLKKHGWRKKARIAERVEQALRDVGLWDEVKDKLKKPAVSLSGGQQQRLCIARALALEPEVVLFDEPCSALDPLSTEIIEDHIRSLRERLTVLVVTHNLGQARRIADDVAVFWTQDRVGTLVESGPARQIFEAPRHQLTAAYVSGRAG